MNFSKLQKQLTDHEGLRLKPYRCPAGKLTIGIGRNLDDKGITPEEARFMLQHDIHECYADLIPLFLQFELLPDSIQHVLLDMRFNLGSKGFRKFKKMISAVNKGDFKEMVIQMRDSLWYRQVTNRAENLIKMIEG